MSYNLPIMRLAIFVMVLGMLVSSSQPGFAQTHPAGPPNSNTVELKDIYAEAQSTGTIKSLLIQQHGTLLGEKHFGRATRHQTTNIKSASKSIISLLVGIAIDEGIFKSVNEPIKTWFEDYFAAHPDSVKEQITIKDLLTMRAGLETTSFYNYGRWVTSGNWVKFALDQPLEEQPGGEMVYSTGTSHLLSVILTKASGMSTRAFAEKHLFGPLDIRVGGWDRDPQGYYMGGNNLALSPEAMLKIGRMVQQGGVYNEKRIVSNGWIEESLETYTRSNFNPYDYGYMWWKRILGGTELRFAWGYGGQYIIMIPGLDAVVVITSGLPDSDDRNYKEPVFDLLEEWIIPFLDQQNSKF